MLTSVRWLNRYLDPGDVTADEADDVLTHVGFPIEARQDLPDGDIQLDVELTSNRGDCLCHFGLAREIAARSGRALRAPWVAPERLKGLAGGPDAHTATSVQNLVPDMCPRFTARVIRGVQVGPSPKWLVESLEHVGQRSINNVVDVSNFVLFELGHPSHTFDMARLSEQRLVVRYAKQDEPFTALDGRVHKLRPDELVVADAERAVSLAGVIGGLETGVTRSTTNVLLEVATWDPATIRRAARRMQISTDAGYRFERYVDARDLDAASARVAELILETAGGELCSGVIAEGGALAPPTTVQMRTARCLHILGIEVPTKEMVRLLSTIGIGVRVEGSGATTVLHCTIPHHRHDLTREIDLIEEVARLNGFEHLGIERQVINKLELSHPEGWTNRERAVSRMARALNGMGFYETVTFSFLPERQAAPFLPPELRLLKVDEERRKGAPVLRPSLIPSLLTCRKANQDAGVRREGGIRLYETASIFAEHDDGKAWRRQTIEHRNLGLIVDASGKVEGRQLAFRQLRGAIESIAVALGGPRTNIDVQAMDFPWPAFEKGQSARVLINGEHLGVMGVVSEPIVRQWDLDEPVVAAELNEAALIALYPPAVTAQMPPRFPGIERDLSVVVTEVTPWSQFEQIVEEAELERLMGLEFVGVYRGKQVGGGRKSVTLRLRFADPERTLRHDEVDGQVERLVSLLGKELGAELRAG